jgi:hypothetical protein
MTVSGGRFTNGAMLIFGDVCSFTRVIVGSEALCVCLHYKMLPVENQFAKEGQDPENMLRSTRCGSLRGS